MDNTHDKIQYWKGLNDLDFSPEHEDLKKKEFAEPIPLDAFVEGMGLKKVTPRRDFLKGLGFSLGAATLAACNKAPIHKAIPYLIKPEEITPGIPNYYTSSFEGYSVLVKTREGRPIKIEGNPKCPITKGGVDAPGQASVLGLYDTNKIKGPLVQGNDSTWSDLDDFIMDHLSEYKTNNRAIRIVSSSINSPSTIKAINEFLMAFPSAKWIQYEPISYSAISQANKNSFDKEVIPSYHFENAQIIVALNCDFLGSWLSPVEFTKGYTSGRATKSLESKKMSKHIQFETGMSLTGSNADFRYAIKPSQEGPVLLGIYNALASYAGIAKLSNTALSPAHEEAIKTTAKSLWNSKGKALVVSGSNDVSIQILVNAVNSLLDSYGNTIDLDNYSLQKTSNDAEFADLVKSMNLGEVDALILYGVNPAYDFGESTKFTEGLKKVKLKVSLSDRLDETASLCDVVAPDQHYLEAWNDVRAKSNLVAIQQPTINPLFDSRTGQQNFLNWSFRIQHKSISAPVSVVSDSTQSAGTDSTKSATAAVLNKPQDYADFLKSHWENEIFSKMGITGNFEENWEKVLREGFIQASPLSPAKYVFAKDLGPVAMTINKNAENTSGDIEIQFYQSVGLRDGKYSNNPWLLELPDPVTKVTWDNYIAMSMLTTRDLNLKDGDMVTVTINGVSETFPVLVQPGQANGTGSIALGYGRTMVGKAGNLVGKNAYPFVHLINGSFQYHNKATLVKGESGFEFARTQDHNTIEGRSMAKETILSEYIKNPYSGSGRSDKEDEERANIWDDFPKKGHHWGMSIDLNACTGCNACVVACNAENNVAVVGRSEVHRRREMHWIRIDRYYSFNEVKDGTGEAYTKESEIKSLSQSGVLQKMENVSVFYQPMLCQQCDHAPCETVCPVLATMHSSEGLNMQVYNRCFGTRYCANNCPYKVRRFNWFKYFDNDDFDYQMNSDLGKMVLNPDVTVRSRGVMEKCTFCVQRIQAGKLEAKIAQKPLEDGVIQTACQQTCPANAIVFGDINDPNSEVAKLLKNERTYYVLDELGVRPGIGYMTKVRNRDLVFNEANPESL
jgi:molybdopterin-containing oxidoreductase family iron-sulfur binding subunit